MIILSVLFCTVAVPAVAQPVRTKVADIYFGRVEPPVVAQQDITVRAPTSNQELEPKPLECSGIAWANGYLIITSDRHRHIIFTCPIDLDTMTIGQPQPHVLIRNEQSILDDAESVTVRYEADGSPIVYVMCSLSNGPGGLPLPMRRHMLRLTIEKLEPLAIGRPIVLPGDEVREAVNTYFKHAGVQSYRTYYANFAGTDKNTYRWGNVEGIAFTPDGSVMLCGMRNPLYGGKAIVFAVRGLDKAFLAEDPTLPNIVDMFSLELGERGISDLCWDPVTEGYLMTAAKSNGPKLDNDQPFPPNSLDGALYWWSGRKKEKPILIARMPDMKVEAVCRLGDSRFIAVGSDEGDVSEGRAARQSILTIIDFPGATSGRQGAIYERRP
ncbi:MAG: hypothetical protein ABIF19_16075 [Planctomycetota bacterium]